MLWVGANNHDFAMPADDAALIANRFDRWSYFHVLLLLIRCSLVLLLQLR